MDYQVEDKQFDFLSKDFKKPKSFIYRISVNGKRYYYEMEKGRPVIYASGTTLISDGYPEKTNAMEQWRVKMRVEGKDPDAYANYRAGYGTLMHILYGNFLMGKRIPLSNLASYITGLKDTKLPTELVNRLIENNLEELKKDVLAFAQFVKDYNVRPLSIEMMIRSKKYKVATAIDLVCELDTVEEGFFGEVYKTSNSKTGIKKGDPKKSKRTRRAIALVDFKSGKKGFFDKHALQLLLNKKMIQENYPDLKIEGIFNFAPKDWRGTPNYSLKDQTENPVLNELEEVFNLGKKRHLKKNKLVKIYSGSLSIDEIENFDFSKNYSTMELEDYIISQKDNNKNSLDKILEKHNIKTASSLRVFLNKCRAPYLKDLSKDVGIKYKTKQDFINKLNKKFIDAKGNKDV